MGFLKKTILRSAILVVLGGGFRDVSAVDLNNPKMFNLINSQVSDFLAKKQATSPKELAGNFVDFDKQLRAAKNEKDLSVATANGLRWFTPPMFHQMFMMLDSVSLTAFVRGALRSPLVADLVAHLPGIAKRTIPHVFGSSEAAHQFISDVKLALSMPQVEVKTATKPALGKAKSATPVRVLRAKRTKPVRVVKAKIAAPVKKMRARPVLKGKAGTTVRQKKV